MMTYDVFPIDFDPGRAEILSHIIDLISATENVFADYTGTCEEECVAKGLNLTQMCNTCKTRRQIIARSLTAPDTRTWEVWKVSAEPEVVGIISFTSITPIDAKAHYIFFDERLSDKTKVLKEMVNLAFEDMDLKRLTIEVPRPFAALVSHASRKLGFGGPFRYTLREATETRKAHQIHVEGVKKDAVKWKGDTHDLLILGLRKSTTPRTPSAPPQTSEAPTPETQAGV